MAFTFTFICLSKLFPFLFYNIEIFSYLSAAILQNYLLKYISISLGPCTGSQLGHRLSELVHKQKILFKLGKSQRYIVAAGEF